MKNAKTATSTRVLNKYRASSVIGTVAQRLISKKVIPFATVASLAKKDKVNPVRLIRRLNRHGKAKKAWSVERDGKNVRMTITNRKVLKAA